MATPDKVIEQAYDWFRKSVERAVTASSIPAGDRPQVEQLIWRMLGVLTPAAPPANPDLSDFADTGAHAQSIAVAAQIVAESLAALEYVKQAVDALQPGGNPAAALAVVTPVMQQIERLSKMQAGSRYPSAFSLGKMLLTLSGDAEANPASGSEAAKLAGIAGATSATDIQNAQTALGLITLFVGSVIDRSFSPPANASGPAWVQQALPNLAGRPRIVLTAPAGLGGTFEFATTAPVGVKAALNLALDKSRSVGGSLYKIALNATSGASVFLPIAPPGPTQVSADLEMQLSVSKSSDAGALVIGSDALGVKLAIGELGVALRLKNGEPRVAFFARKARATLKPQDAFLKLVLGDGINLDLAVEAEADRSGALRLTNGTGLKASLPVPTLPTGPFKLQLIHLGLEPVDNSFLHLKIELSASFGVDLGPFAASVDRLGILLDLDVGNAGDPLDFAFKPPSGIGLVLDAGIVKGGGYLEVSDEGYAGVLELKMLAVGIKAIAVLNTKSEAGFSLLLLIFGQFPPIQLSFGFTLTGIGGLIGVQHTASPTALSQGISNGSLDAVLFPANPVADAPRIINTLRTLFPVKKGGFVIGPMLELGWGTPSLVTVRLGLLVEANQFVLLGQAIVQLPPLVSADLSLLYLRLDFVGSVVFDPLRIAFDAKLVNSRVAFISITGQFAFRAQFGNQPTFLISAGGFHPRFKEIPSDIPMPFDRVGSELRHRHRGRVVQGLFRDHLGDDTGRLVAPRMGRCRDRRHRRRLRFRRDLLSRAPVLLRARPACLSRRARIRHRLRLRAPRRPARGTRTLAHRGPRESAHAVAASGLLAERRRGVGHRPRHAAGHRQRRRAAHEGNREHGQLVRAVAARERKLPLARGREGAERRARASAGHPRLPAEARAVRIAHGQGERQQGERRERVPRPGAGVVAGR